MYLILGSPFFARLELFDDSDSLQVLKDAENELATTLDSFNKTLNELVDDVSYT